MLVDTEAPPFKDPLPPLPSPPHDPSTNNHASPQILHASHLRLDSLLALLPSHQLLELRAAILERMGRWVEVTGLGLLQGTLRGGWENGCCCGHAGYPLAVL